MLDSDCIVSKFINKPITCFSQIFIPFGTGKGGGGGVGCGLGGDDNVGYDDDTDVALWLSREEGVEVDWGGDFISDKNFSKTNTEMIHNSSNLTD